MIVFTRTAGIAPGKTASAIKFGHQIASYMKSKFGVELEVLVPIGGNPQRLAWAGRYKDMATMEAVRAKMLADKKYMELAAKGTDNFVPGSMRDAMWQTV